MTTVGAVFGLGLLAPTAAGQVPQRFPQVPARSEPSPIEFATGEEDNLYSLSRSQEDIHEWELGLAELAAGEDRAAVERLHRLLQSEVGGVVPVSPGRFLGLRLAVVTTMANLEPSARDAYETLVLREAGNLGNRALHDLEPDQLELLARRFPTAALGQSARLRLGDLAFVAGKGMTAANHYRQALDATAIGSAEERRIAERLHCAAVLVQPGTARASSAARTLSAAGDDVLAVLPAAADPTTYSAIGGGGDGRLPMARPAGRPKLTTREDLVAPGFDYRESGTFAMFPIGDLDGIFVNTGSEVLAYDPLQNDVLWMSRSPMVDADPGEHINNDMVLAAACGDDTVVAALQVPEKSVNVDFQASFRIISKIPQRRLFAYSRRTGKEIWAHYDELDGPRTRRFRGHDSCGPPLVIGDTVYAPVHDRSGAIAFSVGAYDLGTGQPKWRRLVCSSQQDVNMFGNARMEFASSPLAVADGVVYGATNLGVVYAIEAATGRIRWITSHKVVRMPRTQLQNQQERPVYFANNPPVVADNVVCFTPLDSQFVLGIDTETGRVLWRLSADAVIGTTENNVRWLAGVLDDEFLLAGRGAVAVKARPQDLAGDQPVLRQLVRPDILRTRGDAAISSRPAVTADHIWFARAGRILGFDRAGNPVDREQQITLDDYQPGNLLLVDGIVVSVRQRSLDILMDAAALRQRIEERLAAAPDDPSAILRLATLQNALLPADARPAARATLRALYSRGLAACEARGLPKNHPTRQALQRELFGQAIAEATEAVLRGDERALHLLVQARDAAPDGRSFVHVQERILERCSADPARLRSELLLLEREADTEVMPESRLPVRTYVAWQRALLPDQTASTAVAAWQGLLEEHGRLMLPTGPVASVAEAAIAHLVAQHGPEVYAPVAARADAALARAANDPEALQDVSTRFPNALAARTARMRLLDASVRNGDLGLACTVLAQGMRSGEIPPGIVRRVLVAASARGNHGLARAMRSRLERHANVVSDWPDDNGATYGVLLGSLAPGESPAVEPLANAAPATMALTLPEIEVARIPVRTRSPEAHVLVPTVTADGFDRPGDQPFFAVLAGELQAIDLAAPTLQKPVLFAQPVQAIVHVILCGRAVVVTDLERVFAIDHRSGELLWELPNGNASLYDSLGVQAGVLHVFAQTTGQAGGPDGSELLGIEPLTGVVLFRRTLPGERQRPVPKPVAGHLLVLETTADGGVILHHLDPLTGATERTVLLTAALLRDLRLPPDVLAARTFPRELCAFGDYVYLPIDRSLTGEAPRVIAIDATGTVAWQWQGHPGTRLLMASRGDRIVVIESSEQRPGRIELLAARDGSVLRSADLGPDTAVLNWEVGWHSNPAPAVIALSDRMDQNNRRRRFVAFGVDEGQPTFEVPLAIEDGEVERQPQFGSDFVTFGVRPAARGPFRLYSVKLADRTGALASGAKYQRLNVRSAHGVAAYGAYTVVSSSECLLVLGADQGNK